MTKETMDLLEELIQNQVTMIFNADEDYANRSRDIQDLTRLVEKLTEAEIADETKENNAERRRMDEEKNVTAAVLEEKKLKIDWKQYVIEIGKILVPTVIPLVIWRKSYKEMITFEETGRFTSSASRELKLPKILK